MRMLTTLQTTLTPEKNPYAATPVAARTVHPKSPWHSPVPYLFGGLAAMLGLIAFALLILACSYWKLSRDDAQQQQNNEATRDLESGEKGDEVSKLNGIPIFEEKIVVIMAGNDKPTFLATPSLMLSSKFDHDHDDDDDDGHHHHHHEHDNHSTNAKDIGANKEGSSISSDDDDGHVEDEDDDDDDKEDETTHHPPQN